MAAKPPSDQALAITALTKSYGSTQALAGVSITVERGTIHALLGGNGSGKSTLIKILAGVVSADGGALDIDGESVAASAQTPFRAASNGLHFVHQQDSTFADMTVAENMALGKGFETGFGGVIRWRSQHRRCARVLERFGIPARPNTLMRDLGPAQHMMVAIARALQGQETAHDGILVLDEPTASLPPLEVEVLLSSLKRYASNGQTILYVTHRLEEVARVADRATVLRDGNVVATVERTDLNASNLTQLIVGDEVSSTARQPRAATPKRRSGVLLSVPSIAGGPGLRVHHGEIVGVAGLLGSGRTALLRSLAGSGRDSLADVLLDGKRAALDSVRAATRMGVVYVPEDRSTHGVFADLSVSHNLSLPVLSRHLRAGALVSQRSEAMAAQTAMQNFRIVAASVLSPLGALSGGNQQKVVFARWLQLEPKLMLLDEPSQGVDVGARVEIHAIVRDAVARGAAALVVCSDFEELAMLCDRAIIMRNGRISAELSQDELSESALDAAVYGGGVRESA